MDTNSLLDEVKKLNKINSEYALAKLLGVSQQALQMMRQRGLSDERVLQVATLLSLDPGELIAWVHAERAKNPDVKSVWKKMANSMRTALGALLPAAIVIGVVASSSNDAHAAAIASPAGNSELCILCQICICWPLVRFFCCWSLCFHACGHGCSSHYSLALTVVTRSKHSNDDNQGYGFAFSDQTAGGLRVRYADDANRWINRLEVAACMQMHHPTDT